MPALTDRLASDIGKLLDIVETQAETIASHGTDLATAQASADAANTAASAANDKVSALQKQVDDLTTQLATEVDQAPLAALADRIEAVTNATPAPVTPVTPPAPAPDAPAVAVITNPTPTTTVAVVPVGADTHADVTTTSGDAVTVLPGNTMLHDASTGVATFVPHDGSDPSAIASSGMSVTPDPTVVAAAIVATTDAGVTVPATPSA